MSRKQAETSMRLTETRRLTETSRTENMTNNRKLMAKTNRLERALRNSYMRKLETITKSSGEH